MNKPMSPLLRFVFGFVAFNALLGAGSLLFFPNRTDTLFFWEIKPAINAALFGALYLGGAAVVGWVTLRGAWEPARFLIPVLVSAGVFISLTTLVHLERFTPGLKLAYWLIIYVGAPILALGFYLTHERRGANWSAAQPIHLSTRVVAGGLGAVLLLVGLGLWLFPAAAIPLWPWPMTPLMLRVFAAWFGAFGVGLLWFLVERDWTRVRQIANLMLAASALDLLMIFIHRGDLTTTGLRLWVYVFHLALFGVVGALLHGLQLVFAPRVVKALATN